MRPTQIPFASTVVAFAALVLGGCTVGAEGAEAPTATASSALRRLGYSCGDGFCTCTGDPDCNDMFSGTECGTGPKSAICQINGAGVPRCRCSVAALAKVTSGAPAESEPVLSVDP